MSWKSYLERHAQGRTNVELGLLAEVSGAQVGKWRNGRGGVDAATVIRFARAVGDKPVGALVEAGFLEPSEARQRPAAPPSLSALADDELLAEVRARMSEGRDGHGQQPAPIGEVGDLEQVRDSRERRQRDRKGRLEDAGITTATEDELIAAAAARKTGRTSRVQQQRDEQDQDAQD